MGVPRVSYDGLAPADLAARIRAPSCLVLPAVSSTLDLVHELASEGAPSGTVVLADQQLRGRGREGRRWYSRPGAAVLLGYLYRPPSDVVVGVLALRVGLAVIQTLGALSLEARIKWPNDVVLDDRKAGGILCEARSVPGAGGWVGVGIGLNVHGPVPAGLEATAIALDQVQPDVQRVAVLEHLIPRLHQLSDAPALSPAEQEAYRRSDWLAGRQLEAPLAGRASGVDPDGALVIETPAGRQRVLAGSVVVA